MTADGAPSALPLRAFTAAGDAPSESSPKSQSLRSVAQQRVVEYQRLLAGTHAALALVAFALSLSADPRLARSWRSAIVGLALVAVLLLAASVIDRERRSRSTIAIVDGATTITVMTVSAASILWSAAADKGEVLGMVLTLTLLLRVAVVPSPALRTLAIGLVCALIEVISLRFVRVDDDEHALSTSRAGLLALGVYLVIIVLVTTKASRLIHGLHEQAFEAKLLGQYTLVEKVGEGGMGSVWRARHALLRRPTAVKLMHGDRTSERDVARFEREVQLTSQLTHPNTVAIFDYGRSDEGALYYVMEYVDGLSLEQLVEEHGRQPAARVVHLLRQIAAALAEAHGLGLIHRDVKPANVLVCERGGAADVVKVVDFGLVKALAPGAPRTAVTASDANLIAGTPGYLAPEAILRPDDVDARADLYALGALGYYLLAARPVFDGTNLVEICSHHLHTSPRPLSELAPGVPPALEELLLRCLAKDPNDRPPHALALKEELDAIAEMHPWSEKTAMTFWLGRTRRGARAQYR